MSNTRTMMRKLRSFRNKLSDPENQRIKPGTPDRRVRKLDVDPRTGLDVPAGVQLTLHATKGYRSERITHKV